MVDVYLSSNEKDRNKLKQFLINTILENRDKSWLQAVRDTQLLTRSELNDLENDLQDEEVPLPSSNFINEWKCNSKCMYNIFYKIFLILEVVIYYNMIMN